MLQHLLTLIWNKKRQHFLLFLELFVSFLVLFAVFTMLVYNYGNLRTPRGFEYRRVLSVTASLQVPEGASKDSLTQLSEQLKRSLRNMPGVAAVSYVSSNSPYTLSSSSDNLSYDNISVQAESYWADDDFAKTLQAELLRGRWYNKQDVAATRRPVVINEKLAEKFFGAADPVGRVLSGNRQIVGVVRNLKDKGDYAEMIPGIYQRIDSGFQDKFLIKLTAGAAPSTESQIYKTIMHHLPGSSTEIEKLEDKRVVKNRLALVPVVLMLVISGFLVLNVALGIYGVVWYSVNKRRGELGLRKAVGATAGGITRQIVGEALVLTSLPLLLGIILAVQFPLLHLFDLPATTYIAAILLAAVFLYVLVSFCALYPGRQAAKIYPAVALHED
ncbi:ABC transporter permease [Chitinophaga rhizosphaerae]|uniref:ABC transporter permease n=1 Tax=Chitinophaga rhizosphaerae TaxID=1864947 RepID=UPI000F8052B6|nr:ABC transporter permease [Chitinophaga rhizosphaerae]